MAGPVVISIVGDSKDLISDLGRSESRLQKFGKVAKFGALGVGAALAGAAVGAFKLAKAAAEDQQSAALMARQFKASAGATDKQVASTEKWITKQGLAKGVADDQLRPALSELVVATHSVSGAQKLANLAMDISAAKGKDLGSVSKALAKAQNGNVGALGKLGIATKDAAGKQLSMAQITKNLGKEFGGAATTKANTFSGMVDRVKLVLGETGEAIGAKMLPALTKAGTWFVSNGVPAIMRFGDAAGKFLGPIIRNIGTGISAALPYVMRLGQMFIGLIPTVQSIVTTVAGKLKPVLDQLVTTFKVQVLPTLIRVQPTVTRIVTVVLQTTGVFLKLAATILGKVLPPVIRFAGFLFARVIPAAIGVISVIVRVIATAVRFGVAIVQAAGKAVTFAAKVISAIAGIPSRVTNAIGALVQKGKDLITGVVRGITSKAGDMATTIKSKISGLGGKITGAATELVGTGKDLIRGIMTGIGQMAGDIARKMIDVIQGAVSAVKHKFGINSPSKVTGRILGKPMAQGVGVGFQDEMTTQARIMATLSKDLVTTASSRIAGSIKPTTYAATPVAQINAAGRPPLTLNITIEVPVGASGADIGRELVEYIKDYYAAGGDKL